MWRSTVPHTDLRIIRVGGDAENINAHCSFSVEPVEDVIAQELLGAGVHGDKCPSSSMRYFRIPLYLTVKLTVLRLFVSYAHTD